MKRSTNLATPLPVQDEAPTGPDRLSDHNFRLLHWLIDHELRAAERYRRFVALVLVGSEKGPFLLKDILIKTKRDCDKLFELEGACAIVMSETDQSGALAAVERYKALFSEDVDLRFAIVSFPLDGVNCADLFAAGFRRMDVAKAAQGGAVVCRD